jgi:putative membrane protein
MDKIEEQNSSSSVDVDIVLNDKFELNEIEPSEDAQQWQSLSPIAMLYFSTSFIKQLAGNFIYLIPALVVGYNSFLKHPFIWLPAIAVVLGLLALFAFLSFKVYRYRLTEDNIEIRSGVFSKKHLNLPFSRVQNVKIEQPFYYRISGHACLKLDTAGSAKNEAKLIAIKLENAEQLKTQIQQVAKQASSEIDNEHSEDGVIGKNTTKNEVLLNQRQLSDLVIHGITSNRIWILLGGLAPFYDNILEGIGNGLESVGIDLSELFSLETHSMLEVGLYALSLTMLFMLLLVSFSVIGAIISFYGFTLSKLGDKYIRRSGLITKHEVSMRLSRLQMIVRKQDWLDVLLKRINLKLEQNSSIGNNFDPSAANNKILVPSVYHDECHSIIDDAYPGNQLASLIAGNHFESISKRYITRNIVYIWLPLYSLISAFALLNLNFILCGVVLILFLMTCALVVLSWKRWGITRDDQFTYVRKGLLGVDYYCFEPYKIQQCQFKQSVFLKKHHLASVKFVLACGSVSVPMIDENLAYQLVDEGLYQVESCEKSWM